MTSDKDLSMMFSRYSPAFFRRVCSKQSDCFACNETIFYAWWVARGEVRKLEGFGRLVMGFANFSPLNTVVPRKVIGSLIFRP